MKLANKAHKYNEITQQLMLFYERRTFSSPNDFQWRRVESQCKKLIDSSPVDGWTLLGFVNAIACNLDEMKRCLTNAETLGLDFEDFMNATNAFMYAGCFKDAYQLCCRNLPKFDSHISQTVELVHTLGGINLSSKLILKARKMNIELPSDAEDIMFSAQVAEKYGLDDDLINSHLDLAGDILRKFNATGCYKVDTNDVLGLISGINISIAVDKSVDEIFEMNMILARLEDQFEIQRTPYFEVAFTYLEV